MSAPLGAGSRRTRLDLLRISDDGERGDVVRKLVDLVGSAARAGDEATEERGACIHCGASVREDGLYQMYKICSRCRFHHSMSARERIESLADADSFSEINRGMISLDPIRFSSGGSYSSSLFEDQRRTGLTEAALTGTAAIAGTPIMLIVLDFGFMGGSMGCVVGEKVTLALERAAKRGLPTLAVVTGGGSRIQEGALSLMQMAKTAVAANLLNEAGLPFITVLANPATGQAYGSFANLADIILAEPGAIVGFSSLRVIKRASDGPLPIGAHSAESHMEHGMLDAVVHRTELRAVIGALLDLLGNKRAVPMAAKRDAAPPAPTGPAGEAWEVVQTARHESRPTAKDYMSRMLGQFVELRGDRAYGDDASIISGLGQIAGQTVAVIAQQRGLAASKDGGGGGDASASGESRTAPEGFRKAQRTMNLAAKFSLPVVALVDTAGPDLSEPAEVRGLGNAIANTMALMSGLKPPTISVVIGQAGSGGALALGIADRALMMERAIYTSVTPEEAAEVMSSPVEDAASSMRLTARDCMELGIIDRIVPEPAGGAHSDPDEAARLLERAIVRELALLQAMPAKRRLRQRYEKYRNMGEYSSRVRATVTREFSAVRDMARAGMSKLGGIARRKRGDEDGGAGDGVGDAAETADNSLANGRHIYGAD